MHKNKFIALVILLTMLSFIITACFGTADNSSEITKINIAALRGPTGIGMVRMMDLMNNANDELYINPDMANFQGREVKRSYQFELLGAPEDVVAMVTGGQVDIAAVPSNLASVLYNATGGDILIAAIPTFGTLFMLENGETVSDFRDLRGRTVYATGQGANPEFILRHLLESNGLTPGVDVEIEFLTEHAELAALLAEGMVDIGMLPEPNATAAQLLNNDLRVIFDFTEEWNKTSDGNLAMTAVIARREFAENNPDALDNFLFDLKNSIDFAINDVPKAAELCAEFGVIPQAAAAARAIPNISLTFISGTSMQQVIEPYLKVLHTANPQSVGGYVPNEAIYYIPQTPIE